MTYLSGGIAVSSPQAAADALRYTFGAGAGGLAIPKTPTTIATAPRTTTPIFTTPVYRPTTTLPVSKPSFTPAAPAVSPLTATLPTVPSFATQSSGAPLPLSSPVADESAVDSAVNPQKSPLPLILFGLAALFLLNRKGR